jgi:hypothetical protein
VRLLRPRSFLRKGLPAAYGLLSTGYAALDRAPRAAAIAAAISCHDPIETKFEFAKTMTGTLRATPSTRTIGRHLVRKLIIQST